MGNSPFLHSLPCSRIITRGQIGGQTIWFQRLERAAHPAGLSASEFVLQLLKRWFGEITVAELEQQEITAYQRIPWSPVNLMSGKVNKVGVEDGMPEECAINFHHLQTVPKKKIGRPLITLSEEKMQKVGPALCFALGVDLDALFGDYVAGR